MKVLANKLYFVFFHSVMKHIVKPVIAFGACALSHPSVAHDRYFKLTTTDSFQFSPSTDWVVG